jgi:PiT family inorganic phosphate transporter
MDVTLWLILGILGGLYLAWNIGVNDIANSMGTSVGSKVLNLRQAIILASGLTLLGSVLLGHRVMHTIAEKMLTGEVLQTYHAGAFAIILGAGIWVTFCSWQKLPVSTTHSIVGGVLGFGLIKTFSAINWPLFAQIFIAALVAPISGAIAAFFIYLIIHKVLIIKIKTISAREQLERGFAFLQVLTGCYVAFAMGSNVVASAMGIAYTFSPEIAILTLKTLGGIGIALGIITWGYRVLRTVGMGIVKLTPTSGFSAQFSAASVVLFFTFQNLPVSTTHTLVGSIFGVGLASGIRAINLRTVREILTSWLFTIPAAGLVTVVIYGIITTFG